MKVQLSLSVEQEDAEALKRMCEIMGISVSKLMESAVKGYVLTAKASGLFKRKKVCGADLIRLFGTGVLQDPIN